MTSTPPIDNRSWFLSVLDEAGDRLGTLENAGATNLEASWVVDDITVTARKHGEGVTVTTRAADGTVPLQPMTVRAGWLH